MSPRNSTATRSKLLDAARDVIRTKGYAATTVDDICAAAGVTKGGFFHHFPSKEQLGIAAIEQFGAAASAIFASAPYASEPDPRDRVLGYVDFRMPDLDWKSSRPKLSSWYAQFCEYPSMKATAPAAP